MKVANGCWYFTATRGFDSVIQRMSPEGNVETITPGRPGSIDCWDCRDGVFYYVAMRDGGLQELYSLRSEDDKKETCLTSFNVAYLSERTVCAPKHLTFVDSDGV